MADVSLPPAMIDGALVVAWAWSGDKPFGWVGESGVYGLAVATYDEVGYYRFACDEGWSTLQDALYESETEAIDQLPDQYKQVSAFWHRVSSS